MATVFHPNTATESRRAVEVHDTSYQAYEILHIGFAVLPIVAGIDKFFDVLTNWDTYLAPIVTQTLNMQAHTFMMIVGVIEIIAGLLVAIRPYYGGYLVAMWLWGIIVNLFFLSGQGGPPAYDIALRDFGLSLGAVALARLSAYRNPKPFGI
jgi:uncharacterized membrane protein YphA (DoxX/SURF4 family)